MDGHAAIEQNRVALLRIVASLIAMAGLRQSTAGDRQSDGSSRANPTADRPLPVAATLPRHLWLAILRLLRPAESAARRLIIAAARGLSVPPPRKAAARPGTSAPLLRSLGIAIVPSPRNLARAAAAARKAAAPARPRSYCLPLLDPLRDRPNAQAHHIPAHAAPRIMLPGMIEPHRLPTPPSPDDLVSAARLGQRLAALAAALDDLPAHALRFARWKARRDQGLTRRISPLRPGRPPGGRLSRFDRSARGRAPRRIREVDEILAHAHALALHALERPDTS